MRGSQITLQSVIGQITCADRAIKDHPGTGAALVASIEKRKALGTLRVLSCRSKKLTPSGKLLRP